jgi:hypothetical protein
LAVGWWVAVAAVLLTVDLIYEQTFLTWNLGPQMVGFSLMHSGLGALLILSFYLGYLWVPATACMLLWRRKVRDSLPILLMAVYAACFSLTFVPYVWWQEQTIAWWGPSPQSDKYLLYAAPAEREKIRQALEKAGYKGAALAPDLNQ